VYDTEESTQKVQDILNMKEMLDMDLIVGPYRRENIELLTDFSRKWKIPLVSPWVPSSSISKENPYLIQMTPGLASHAEAIMSYIGERFAHPKLYLVARENRREKERFENFYRASQKLDNVNIQPEELIVADTTIDLNETILESIFDPEGPTVFVLPYYSRSEEDFVNSFLRKLHADKLENEVYVFGLPQWLNFRKLNYDYLESLNAHISSAQHLDKKDPSVKEFQTRFYNIYETVPTEAAYQGYDLISYFGKMLGEYGTAFMSEFRSEEKDLFNLGFQIQPISSAPAGSEIYPSVDYHENKRIWILKFEDQYFQKVN
jgi:hypothetical protein